MVNNKTRTIMEEKRKDIVARTIEYTLDDRGHFLSQTPCPFWRMYHNPVNDKSIYVGSAACNCCRWFSGKNPALHTIECSIPKRLADRYEREHQRLEKRLNSQRRLILSAVVADAKKQKRVNRLYGSVKGGRGCLYSENYNKGHKRPGWRYVAEITIGNYRYRLRSASYERCWAWINNIREIYRAVRNRNKWLNNAEVNDAAVLHLAKAGLFGTMIYEGKLETTKAHSAWLRSKVEAIAREVKQ